MCNQSDNEARFAQRLARVVGRVDWWKVTEELSRNELALMKKVIDDGTAR